MQTKKQSVIESLTNTAIGFGVSFASTFLILPLVGVKTRAGTNLIITLYFTIISIARGYVIRRWFNKKKTVQVQQPTQWLYCFSCEFEMPVVEFKGALCCSNCGLIHK